MPSSPFDKTISREPSPTKSGLSQTSGSADLSPNHVSPPPPVPFLTSAYPPQEPVVPSSGSVSPSKALPLPTSPPRMNALPSNAAIDLVIANAMASAPAPPQLGIMDQNARIGNEITRIRTPSAINNLFPAAVGIDGRVNLFVGNLPYRVRWQDLKDLFRRAGTVLRADVSLGQDNRSRGYGTVLMGSREDGAKAIDLFNGFNWQTRTLEVRPDRLPPEYEPQVTHHPQHAPFQPNHMMYPPQFQNQPFNGHFMPSQQQFFRPGQFQPSPGNAFPHMALPHQSALSPMSTGSTTQPQGFTSRRESVQQLLPHQAVAPPRAGSFSSLISGSDPRQGLSPAQDEPIPLGRTTTLSPVPGAIGEKPAPSSGSGPGSSNGSTSGRTAPPTGLGPLPSNVFSKPLPLSSVSPEALSPGTAGSHERPFGALGNGGMIRPPITAPAGHTTGRVLFIHNLPFHCQWQDLKDLLRPAGNIVRADVAIGPDNRSRGYGTVLFASEVDAQNAVRMFNGFEYQGRAIKVYIDRNNDRHSTTPNPPPQRPPSQFQPYPQFPQPFMSHHPSPFGHPSPAQQLPVAQAEVSPTKQAADLPDAKSPKAALSIDTAIASPSAVSSGETKNGSGRSGSGKAPHPGPITMPSYSFQSGNPLSPLQTRGLPPMTPSMPGFVFNAYPQTPPLHPPFMSPGFAPFSPGAPVTSPNVYSYNPFMNAAPGAPVAQPGRWNGYTATAGLRTPQGQTQSQGGSNGDYFSGTAPPLPKLDTGVPNSASASASNSASASPLNAKTRFTSITPAVVPSSPVVPSPDKDVATALQDLALAPVTSSPSSSPRAYNRSSIDFTKRSLAAAWEGAPAERRASDAA